MTTQDMYKWEKNAQYIVYYAANGTGKICASSLVSILVSLLVMGANM